MKKHRDAAGLFVAEGSRLVLDIAQVVSPKLVVATSDWLLSNRVAADEVVELDSLDEMKAVSGMSTPTEILALFPQQPATDIDYVLARRELVLALDTVQDPGNLGTIIRIADWFGIRHIICSLETADVYNPKVVQSTMGAIARVSVSYVDLPDTLRRFASQQWPIYGTFLDGADIYSSSLADYGVIIMGNEGNGISCQVEHLVDNRLLIPPYPADAVTVESLNVGVATAVVCSEFRRRIRGSLK